MDRNRNDDIHIDIMLRRSLRGNVDRNGTAAAYIRNNIAVVPYVGTWIEILHGHGQSAPAGVVPYVGTWIEMDYLGDCDVESGGRSLRGNVDRNYKNMMIILKQAQVVPYVGTWIEIVVVWASQNTSGVVPYVGTWIEILWWIRINGRTRSFPTWERG